MQLISLKRANKMQRESENINPLYNKEEIGNGGTPDASLVNVTREE
jgi:hypothetical protein